MITTATILLSFHSRKWRLVWIDKNVIPLKNKIQLITTEIYSLKYIISFFSQYGISKDWNMFFNQHYFYNNINKLFKKILFLFYRQEGVSVSRRSFSRPDHSRKVLVRGRRPDPDPVQLRFRQHRQAEASVHRQRILVG